MYKFCNVLLKNPFYPDHRTAHIRDKGCQDPIHATFCLPLFVFHGNNVTPNLLITPYKPFPLVATAKVKYLF